MVRSQHMSSEYVAPTQVDNATDAVIQATIRSAFAECTVRTLFADADTRPFARVQGFSKHGQPSIRGLKTRAFLTKRCSGSVA